MIRVALLDEHELVRIGLKTVLRQTPDLDVVADFGTSDVLAKIVRDEHPDLILIDVSDKTEALKNASDLDEASAQTVKSTIFKTTDLLRESNTQIKIVLMSTVFNLDCLLHTLCGNVDGYLLKSASPEELIAAVRATACGGMYIHAKLMEYVPTQLFRSRIGARQQRNGTPLLSEREQNVMDLLVKGYTNREVSEKLYLSPKTIESYRAKIYAKLNVKTRADLFSYAVDRGLVAF
jgi:two-component system response regulator NreC